MYLGHTGAEVQLAYVHRLSFLKGKLLSHPLGSPCFLEKILPGKVKFGLIVIKIVFFFPQTDGE